MTLPLGDRPKKEHFRLLLYKKSEKPHELSWLCLELVIQGNRNGFRVPDDLVAHHDQVIRIRDLPELRGLPSRRVWEVGPRGEREWPKMYSQLLGSRAANAPEKVVVCSPGLGDRLFNTNVAEKFKGHYYLSSDRLYYDVQGRLKSKYFS